MKIQMTGASCYIVSSILCLALLSSIAVGFRVAMKVVESPMAYGFNNDLIMPVANHDGLTLQVTPSNFSGPRQLQQLVGRCYNLTDTQYHYSFCPFHNVTQFELLNRWNAYQGILGVWQEWNIVNNTFLSMRMLKGNKCGSVERSVEVFLVCGDSEKINDVLEPTKCQYHLYFHTRLVCHPQAMLVYPRLSPELQKQWDELETELANQDVTQKGYDEGLKRLFIKAGYKLDKKLELTRSANSSDSTTLGSDVHSLNYTRCAKEVEELKREIEALKLLLELNTVTAHKRIQLDEYEH